MKYLLLILISFLSFSAYARDKATAFSDCQSFISSEPYYNAYPKRCEDMPTSSTTGKYQAQFSNGNWSVLGLGTTDYDYSTICADPSQTYNTSTHQCELPACPSGQTRNPTTQQCETYYQCFDGSTVSNLSSCPPCPSGHEPSTDGNSQQCFMFPCPAGQHRSVEQNNQCVSDCVAPKTFNALTMQCEFPHPNCTQYEHEASNLDGSLYCSANPAACANIPYTHLSSDHTFCEADPETNCAATSQQHTQTGNTTYDKYHCESPTPGKCPEGTSKGYVDGTSQCIPNTTDAQTKSNAANAAATAAREAAARQQQAQAELDNAKQQYQHALDNKNSDITGDPYFQSQVNYWKNQVDQKQAALDGAKSDTGTAKETKSDANSDSQTASAKESAEHLSNIEDLMRRSDARDLSKQASGGTTCDTAPSCSGDAIQCAMVYQTWKSACEGDKMNKRYGAQISVNDSTDADSASDSNSYGATNASLASVVHGEGTNVAQTFQSHLVHYFDVSPYCAPSLSFDFKGENYSFDTSIICQLQIVFKLIIHFFSFMVAFNAISRAF